MRQPIKMMVTPRLVRGRKRDEVLNGVYSSIIDNPYEVRYFRVLSQVLFQKLNDVLQINARTVKSDNPKQRNQH